MSAIEVALSAPVVLYPSRNLEENLGKQIGSPGVPQDPNQVVADLNARGDGVPVRLVPPRGRFGPGLRVYGPGYVVTLSVSGRRDAYKVTGIYPMGADDHRKLFAEGFLRVRPSSWHFVHSLGRVPPGTDMVWSQLEQSWAQMAAAGREVGDVPTATETRNTEFLDALDELIDTARSMEVARQSGGVEFPYGDVAATGGRRDGVGAVYDFRVHGDGVPESGDFVQIKGAPQLRGQVTRTDGRMATVRFADAVDWQTLPRQGALQPTPNTTVYRRQHDAVERLRLRDTPADGLLDVLAGHRTRRFRPSAELPSESLDPEQLAAFQRALAVPDMLAVLGPPGTGKTRTIVEITRSCTDASPPQRVLVTSHTNRAVDNVLKRLPKELVRIRLGDESRATMDGQPYLLDRQASDLRQEILGATAQRAREYEGVPTAEEWQDELARRAAELGASVRAERVYRAELDALVRARDEAARVHLAQAATRVAQIEREAADTESKAERLTERAERSRLAFRARRHRAKAGDLRERAGRLHAERTEVEARSQILRGTLATGWRDDPAVAAAAAEWSRRHHASRERSAEAIDAARTVHEAVAYVGADLGCPRLPDTDAATDAAPTAVADLSRHVDEFCDWLRSALPVLRQRAELLDHWHEDASKDSKGLHPELVRYADVVAATCSGTAKIDDLGDLEIDLAIVDEAGQIGLPDVLVPLVRAKRAVLVGDARQLPPFLEHDIKQWGEERSDPRILDLLTKSALELVVEGVPETNVVQLTRQRRMPPEVCSFISDQFYGGVLTTEGEPRFYRDPVFTRPMAFVYTTFLADSVRHEQSSGRREDWGVTGTRNEAEADLLAELAVLYHRSGGDWAVIVPYRAQVDLVTRKIAARIHNIDAARHGVGTVDAFQGGERDVILYGFTRSNNRGDVGFLRELRRINVALSRVRRQLVMVGDAATLASARDQGFRALAGALRDHLAHSGESRRYEEVLNQARDLNRQGEGA
ncbi:AAA domain-containing protein [Streptomycetaceae bacterium NBC_01309]